MLRSIGPAFWALGSYNQGGSLQDMSSGWHRVLARGGWSFLKFSTSEGGVKARKLWLHQRAEWARGTNSGSSAWIHAWS